MANTKSIPTTTAYNYHYWLQKPLKKSMSCVSHSWSSRESWMGPPTRAPPRRPRRPERCGRRISHAAALSLGLVRPRPPGGVTVSVVSESESRAEIA